MNMHAMKATILLLVRCRARDGKMLKMKLIMQISKQAKLDSHEEACHGAVLNLVNLGRHLVSAKNYRCYRPINHVIKSDLHGL